MKLGLIIRTLTLGIAFSAAVCEASLNFTSLNGGGIQFNGAGQFSFLTSQLGGQWEVTGGGSGAANGRIGNFLGGPWTYGPILNPAPGIQTAAVSPSGSFSLNDGSGFFATGNINWVQLMSGPGALGSLNSSLQVNVTGMQYLGTNPDILALVSQGQGSGSVIVTFQFAPGMSLSQLTAGTVNTTSYSGSIAPVPEPATMIAGALLLLPFGASTIRILRKNRS